MQIRMCVAASPVIFRILFAFEQFMLSDTENILHICEVNISDVPQGTHLVFGETGFCAKGSILPWF